MFDREIAFFGYPVFDPTGFDELLEGFQAYLDTTGITFFSTAASEVAGQPRLMIAREFQRTASWLELSLGLGARTTHVGIGSPGGSREWHYDSYSR